MPGLPEPQPGLVISYAYLWSEEAELGRVEGRKDRPCAIVVAVETPDPVPRKRVAVVPITHAPPGDPGMAIEIPRRVKEHLGLDGERSWVILDEFNVLAAFRSSAHQEPEWPCGLRLSATAFLRPSNRANSGARRPRWRWRNVARRVR